MVKESWRGIYNGRIKKFILIKKIGIEFNGFGFNLIWVFEEFYIFDEVFFNF